MNIHALEIGHVKITQNWQNGRGEGAKRLIHTLFDNTFTDWLPIYVWVIEHPEGLIVIDTGIPADANKRVWFPPFMPLVQRAAKFDISPEQEVGPRLRQLGFAPDDVRWVILTHLHQDHDGGLHHFPKAEFIVSSAEWEIATGFKGRMSGYLNQRWMDNFAPTRINFTNVPFDAFPAHHTLTQAGDIHLVPTPGHSAGHMSVIQEDGGQSIFFAGDTSYTEAMLLSGELDGIGTDAEAQRETYRQILAFAHNHPTVYLPSHDPDAKTRLANRTVIPTSSHEEDQ